MGGKKEKDEGGEGGKDRKKVDPINMLLLSLSIELSFAIFFEFIVVMPRGTYTSLGGDGMRSL